MTLPNGLPDCFALTKLKFRPKRTELLPRQDDAQHLCDDVSYVLTKEITAQTHDVTQVIEENRRVIRVNSAGQTRCTITFPFTHSMRAFTNIRPVQLQSAKRYHFKRIQIYNCFDNIKRYAVFQKQFGDMEEVYVSYSNVPSFVNEEYLQNIESILVDLDMHLEQRPGIRVKKETMDWLNLIMEVKKRLNEW